MHGIEKRQAVLSSGNANRYMVPLYKQASFKPYIIAAMIFLSKVKDPVSALRALERRGALRKVF